MRRCSGRAARARRTSSARTSCCSASTGVRDGRSGSSSATTLGRAAAARPREWQVLTTTRYKPRAPAVAGRHRVAEPPDPQERLLHRFLRICRVRQQQAGGAIGTRVVLAHPVVELVHVPSPRQLTRRGTEGLSSAGQRSQVDYDPVRPPAAGGGSPAARRGARRRRRRPASGAVSAGGRRGPPERARFRR